MFIINKINKSIIHYFFRLISIDLLLDAAGPGPGPAGHICWGRCNEK
jgi:hypothetical protein